MFYNYIKINLYQRGYVLCGNYGMPKILVVDDAPDITLLLKLMLERQHFNVAVASSYREVIDELTANSIDLILLDVQLGSEDGRTICKEIKETYNGNLPIVLISARPDLLNEYKDYHADGSIEKPFNMRALIDQVNALLPSG